MTLSPPSSVGLNGVQITDAPSAGEVLTADSATAASWQAAAGGDFVLIQDELLGSDQASFDFTGIPATYKHLRLVLYGRSTDAAALVAVLMRCNNDSGANYHAQQVSASGATPTGFEVENGTSGDLVDVPGAGATADHFGMSDTLIPHYAGTADFKVWSSHGCAYTSATVAYAEVYTSQWRNTAAISRLTVFPSAGNFLAGSRLTLYGLS